MWLHPFDNMAVSLCGPFCIILSMIEERIIACCNFFLKKKPRINGIVFSRLPNFNSTDHNSTDYDADIEWNKVETEDNQKEERDTQHKCLSSKIQHRANNLIEMVAGKKDNAILEQLQII